MLKGDAQSAASWYQLSVKFSRDSGFPVAYARLVVEHKLSDHVRTALDALRENREIWNGRPWWLRVRDIVLSFVWLNKCHPRWIRHEIRNIRLKPKLERLLTCAQ